MKTKTNDIFICYRREDSSGSTGRIYDRLMSTFNKNGIFMDVDSIFVGEDFVEAIENAILRSKVVIAVIGRNWLNCADERGERRIDDPLDFVRIELRTAVSNKIPIIPVLVDKASMPKSMDLPDDIKPIVRKNAFELSHNQFERDIFILINELIRFFSEVEKSNNEFSEDGKSNEEIITQSTYYTKQGKLTLVGTGDNLGKKIIQAQLNDIIAPDGRYKIGFMWHVIVKNGFVIKTTIT